MSRACSVCQHPRRRDIDAALLSGGSMRDVAGQFAIAKSNLSRHVPHVRAAVSTASLEPVLDIPLQMKVINGVALRWLANGEARVQLQACRVVQGQLEFVHTLETERALADILTRLDALEQARTTPQTRTDRWPHVA